MEKKDTTAVAKKAEAGSEQLLFNEAQLLEKLHRMALQVLELYAPSMCFALFGIGKRGVYVAEALAVHLRALTNRTLPVLKLRVTANEKDGAQHAKVIGSIGGRGKALLLVDDVLNTGATMAVCLAELFKERPKSIHTAVLIERSHKSFPIEANIVGQRLATTLEDYVSVRFGKNAGVYLH